MTTNTLPSGLELPPELLAHQKALDELVDKAKRTRAAVDTTAAQIPVLDEGVQELTAKLAVKDADRCTAEDGEVKALDAEIRKLAEALDAQQRALNRAKNALIIHEARAPEHDEAVQAAVMVLENDLIKYSDKTLDQLRAELLEKVKPLQGVFAALRCLDQRMGSLARDVCDAAFVPDPRAFNRVHAHGAGPINYGTNLLAEAPESEHAQLADAIRAALGPVRASIAAAKGLGTYTPIAARPKPYVRKGQEVGLGWKKPAQPQANGPAPLPPSSGFKRTMKSDGTPIDEEPTAAKLRSLVARMA